jgi:hypothetical protein
MSGELGSREVFRLLAHSFALLGNHIISGWRYLNEGKREITEIESFSGRDLK